MPFQPGQSGNPLGRPKGSRNKSSLAIREWATSIAVSPATSVVSVGTLVDMTVTINYSNGSQRLSTSSVHINGISWTSSDESVVTTSTSGTMGTHAVGAATITCTFNAWVAWYDGGPAEHQVLTDTVEITVE